MSELRIKLNSWQYNAGVVGLYNILKFYDENSVKILNEEMVFDSEILKNFEEKYFSYLINKYKSTLSWNKIVDFKSSAEQLLEKNIEEITTKEIENLNTYIKDVLKYYLKSASYKAAYEVMDKKVNLLELEKELTVISLKKEEKIENKKLELEITLKKILEIIEYCEKEEVKKYLAGKNVIYTIIKNSWNGICFLNPQTKEKDIYHDYKNYFIKPVEEYLYIDKTKFKYNCFVCNKQIKDLSNDLSFLNSTGFDTSRKPAHVWNFINDIALCPICKLVYSCIPAGFNYVHGNGIFINYNYSFQKLLDINTKIEMEVFKPHKNLNSLTYRALCSSLEDEMLKSKKYELIDIQVVRYENEKYYFNILSKNVIKVIENSKEELESLIKTWYSEIKTSFRIYEETMKKIMNNENLYVLIHKLLVYKLSQANNGFYSTIHIINLLKINIKMIKGDASMGEGIKNMIGSGWISGMELKKEYKLKDAEGKISGICYRILNGLKTNNKEMVLDTVLNCYMYIKKPVPFVITEMLKDTDSFKEIGYSFVAGLLSEEYEKNIKENN